VTEQTTIVSKKTPSCSSWSATSYAQIREAEPAQRMVRRPRRDGVGPAAGRLHLAKRLLPAFLDADAELGANESDIGPDQSAGQDVADLVVNRVRPVDPALLDQHAPQTDARRHRGHLASVIGLHTTDRNQRVAALGERVGDQVLQLAGLVPAVGNAGVAVLPLGPEFRAAQVGGQPLEPVHR
jgi:hypothetical protein